MATEKRLIDVNKAIAYMNQIDTESPFDDKEDILEKCVNILHIVPTVDAVEVVHARWIKEYDEHGIDRGWKCSHCKGSVYDMTYEPYAYCPNCSAKMEGDVCDGN